MVEEDPANAMKGEDAKEQEESGVLVEEEEENIVCWFVVGLSFGRKRPRPNTAFIPCQLLVLPVAKA